MRKGRSFLVALAIGVGVLGAGAMYLSLRLVTEETVIVVAAQDIPARKIVRAEDLQVLSVPVAAADPRAIRDPKEVIGKVLLSPVFQGEQIRPERLSADELALGVEEVAVGFETDLVSTAGGMIRAGDLVDIFLSFNPAVTRRTDVIRVAEGVRVLSIRDASARPLEGNDETNGSNVVGNQSNKPAVVVLKVPRKQVILLRQAANLGTLTLARRSPLASAPEEPLFPADLDALIIQPAQQQPHQQEE